MLCSVTDDSSLGGAAGAPSAGLSAGLASLSCARTPAAIAANEKISASAALRVFTRVIFALLGTDGDFMDRQSRDCTCYYESLDCFVRRAKCKKSSPVAEESRKSSEQSFTIQSAPACRRSASLEVVRRATTREPAALPARMPAGASSMTMQSAADVPRSCAPRRYGSGSGLPFFISSEVTKCRGCGKPAALMRTCAKGRVQDVTMAHRSIGRD